MKTPKIKAAKKPPRATPDSSQTAYVIHLVEVLSQHSANEERQSEQRIAFFLTLATGTIAAIALLHRNDFLAGERIYWVMEGALSVLLMFGFETLNRLNWRVINSRQNSILISKALKKIQSSNPVVAEQIELRQKFDQLLKKKRIRGSPAEFMYLTNALLIAGLTLTIGLHSNWPLWVKVTGPALLGASSILAQWKCSCRVRDVIKPSRFGES